MEKTTPLDILKQAILLERRGMAFYRSISRRAENEAVREVFEMLASEEKKHIQTLSEHAKAYQQGEKRIPGNYENMNRNHVASKVLTDEIKEKISAAGFEAAAISAGIAMEERAIKLYTECAQSTSDPDAKALYEWLARWEHKHLDLLMDIDNALKEKIWFDNKFWPF